MNDAMTDKPRSVIRPDGKMGAWSLRYQPHEADGRGRMTVTLDHFGLFNIQSGGHHVEIYVDELTCSRLLVNHRSSQNDGQPFE